MSAKLVRHMSTTPITRVELEVRSNIQQRAEYLAGRTPGQLWERVAEAEPRATGTRYDLGFWNARSQKRGPRLSDMTTTRGKFSHGIIRAGQRVR